MVTKFLTVTEQAYYYVALKALGLEVNYSISAKDGGNGFISYVTISFERSTLLHRVI
jgi:hypothetical protein